MERLPSFCPSTPYKTTIFWEAFGSNSFVVLVVIFLVRFIHARLDLFCLRPMNGTIQYGMSFVDTAAPEPNPPACMPEPAREPMLGSNPPSATPSIASPPTVESPRRHPRWHPQSVRTIPTFYIRETPTWTVKDFLPELGKPSIASAAIGGIRIAASAIIGAEKPARKNWAAPTWIASPTMTPKRLRATASALQIAKTAAPLDSVRVRTKTTLRETITFSRRPPSPKSHKEFGDGKNPVEQKKQVASVVADTANRLALPAPAKDPENEVPNDSGINPQEQQWSIRTIL